MGKYKICVYAICKNEEKFVDKWMDSMSEADMIVVTDTGSTDSTVEKLRERGATVYIQPVSPWRFDVARNNSLDNVPEDVDICVCTDLDELFDKGWREKLENQWVKGAHQGKYMYNWSLKPDGTPHVQFVYFKVHTRDNFRWVYPIHEVLKYTGSESYKDVYIDGMVLNHYPDETKSRGSYIGLLEMAVAENPEDDRMMYYLGREYMYKGMNEKCIETLKKHLSLKSATWLDERCASMRWIALCYGRLGNIKEAYSWYYKAIAEQPYMRDAYVEFARLASSIDDFETMYFMASEALKIKNKSTTYINAGYAWDYTPYDIASIGCYYLGMYDKSYELAKEALSLEPNDDRLKANVRFSELKLKKHENK